jgi:leader peptidase (prepilin peptidase)/N-methyltransferase
LETYLKSLALVPSVVWNIMFFVYGALIGSFLNVVIHRIPRNEEIIRTPSHCGNCGAAIPWYLNIPILSWFMLGGKTFCCKERFSFRYPLVELLFAMLSSYLFIKLGFSVEFFAGWIFSAMIISLIMIDWEHMRLPNVITLPGAALGLLFALLPGNVTIWDALIGLAIGAGGFLALATFYKSVRNLEALGMGDVKLMAMVGAFLGWRPTLLVVFMGSFLGLGYGVFLMIKNRTGGKTKLPFGVFLGLAALITLLWGDLIVNWYLSFYPNL